METPQDLIQYVSDHKLLIGGFTIIILSLVYVYYEIKNAPIMPDDYED